METAEWIPKHLRGELLKKVRFADTSDTIITDGIIGNGVFSVLCKNISGAICPSLRNKPEASHFQRLYKS